ncbi:MAG: hypothetical protein GY939_13405 [Actinomycetia bacterium]|nr:hypothetical protein [Actinomycetes bacterium]
MSQTSQLVLIGTKLVPEVARSWLVERPELLSKLDSAKPLRLAAVVAPAGYGKTTFVGAWTRNLGRGVSIGWLSLDERDSDPVRFWTYLVECVAGLGCALDEWLLAELQTDPTAGVEVSAAITNELTKLDGHQVIVLDDLHNILDTELVDSILEFIKAVPESTTVVVTSRTMPAWPLERLRAMGEAVVFGADDLAFTRAETAALLSDVVTDPATIEIVHDRTGGWPVVVRLAVEGLKHNRDPGRLVEGLSGTSNLVAGFLIEEILESLNPELRRFLLDAAVVGSFSVPLAEALTDRHLTVELVEKLLSQPVFVEPDEGVSWYGPHPLIRDLLLAELEAEDPARIPVLHRRAGDWYRSHGDTSKAVEHLIAAGAFDEALELINAAIEPYWAAGQMMTVRGWFELMPIEEIDRRPEAACQLSLTLTAFGRFAEARGWLDLAARSARTDQQKLGVIVTSLYLERGRGDVVAVIEQLDAMDRLADDASDAGLQPLLQAHQWYRYGFAMSCYEVLGEDDKRRAADIGFQAYRAKVDPAIVASIDNSSALYKADDGELGEAEHRARLALRITEQRGYEGIHMTAKSHVALARVAWCRGRLEDAEAALGEATRLDRGEVVRLGVTIGICAAEIYASLGRNDRVDEILDTAFEGSEQSPLSIPAPLRVWQAGWAMWICAAHDRLPVARRWLATVERFGTVEQLSSARWARAQLLHQRPELVVARFGIDGGDLPKEPLPQLQCGLVLDAALQLEGHQSESEHLAHRLLVVAKRHELLQPLIDEPTIVQRYRGQHADPDVRSFVDHIRTRPGDSTRPDDTPLADDLVEGLTARELDIVQHLPTRLTNQEIANELYVSLNTIKSHLRSIYRKLGVASRNEAIERCRGLNFI